MAFRALTRFAAPASSLVSRAFHPSIYSSAARVIRAFSPAISSVVSSSPSSVRAFSSASLEDEYGGGFVTARITRPAPTFTADAVVKGEFKTISLSDYKGKYVVLLFYPLDFTFVCPTELISFSEKYSEFQKNNCEVLGISVDSKFTHLAWTQTPRSKGGIGNLNFPLVSDLTKSIASDYDVLLDKGVALRGLFIIDDKGVLRSKIVNDLPVGRSVDETLRLVQAFQYTDKSGDVIPCDWKPGKDTMKGDPKGSQAYFKKVKDN